MINPGSFRELDDVIRAETKGQGTLEILTVKNMAEGDETL